MTSKIPEIRTVLFSWILWLAVSSTGYAAEPELVELTIENHLFNPAELQVSAGVRLKLIIHNLDATPEEFESHELNREKVIMGNSQGIIYLGPLEPGTYHYFGEFNQLSAQGVIEAR